MRRVRRQSLRPMAQMAMAAPRCSTAIRSAIVPPPSVMGATPRQPARNRKPINMFQLVESAQPTVKQRNSTLETLYTMSRPNISLIGARTIGPKANPRISDRPLVCLYVLWQCCEHSQIETTKVRIALLKCAGLAVLSCSSLQECQTRALTSLDRNLPQLC